MAGSRDERPLLPEEPIHRIVEPLARFLHVEAAGGVVLLACTALALGLANSPWSEAYLGFWKTPVGFEAGPFHMVHSLKHWINDALMALFFFVIGLEVKRELVLGELRDARRAALPIAAALGGMVAPAALYLALQAGTPGERGWGIPMATDIAFVVGCMAVLGPRVPSGLRVLLLSLAIADDIGAILVIAIGYTDELVPAALGLAAVAIVAVLGLARLGMRSVPAYAVLGVIAWFGFHESGVHATIAGVILGLATPAHSWVSPGRLADNAERVADFLRGEGWRSRSEKRAMLRKVEVSAREAVSPLERLEAALHPWSGFAIMPVFALANAGVRIHASDFGDPVAAAVMLGLVLGKPIGVVAASLLAVRLGLARLPDGVDLTSIVAGGCLAGIGFTMALFIAGLALAGPALDAAKVGILAASALSAALGMGLLLIRGAAGTGPGEARGPRPPQSEPKSPVGRMATQ
jgi:Na+:H+ antiporter, NhaA family